MRKLAAIVLVFFIITNCAGPEYETFEYRAGSLDLEQTLAHVDLGIDITGTLCLEAGGEIIPAQSERISLYMVRVWWLANQSAGETVEYTIRPDMECSEADYTWQRTGDQSIVLEFEGSPIIQYEHPVYDRDNIDETMKAFHHVFSPITGQFITKGPGGLFSHHRGIFFGYNQVAIGDRVLDFWHNRNGERQQHAEIITEFSGPVFGGHKAMINWTAPDDEIWFEEHRDLRAHLHTDGSYLIDFTSEMYAIAGLIRLGGDLQHAGVQFRAAQYVADNPESTRFIRPADWEHIPQDEELGEDDRIGLPWNAMQFEIEGNTYTVVYMSHPNNPSRNTEMSERKYGRFGEFFPAQQSEGAPLIFRYRFWVVPGESPSVDEIDRMYRIYAR